MSWRQELVAAIAGCLGEIKVADGYNTDAGHWVTTEPGQIDDEDPGVLAVVIERQVRSVKPAVSKTHRLTTVALILKVPHAQDAAQTTIDAAIEDVEHAMARRQQRFPAGISYPEYVEMLPIPAAQGMGWVGAVIRYESDVPITPRPKT